MPSRSLPRRFHSRNPRRFRVPSRQTARREVEEAAVRQGAEGAIHSFVSRLSHELRTPVTAIHGSLCILADEVLTRLDGEGRELVEIAKRNVLRLIGLIDEFLSYEKLSCGGVALRPSRQSVRSLAAKAAARTGKMAEERRITVRLDGLAGWVQADPQKIGDVLAELLSNAIKASPPESEVVMSSQASAPWVEIFVSNPGAPIPAQEQPLIFLPFYQTHESRNHDGTGLGLAIAKAIVDQHGGSIGVDSAPGRETTFWVRLKNARP